MADVIRMPERTEPERLVGLCTTGLDCTRYADLRRGAAKLLRASLEVLALCTYKGDLDRNFIKDRELIEKLGDAADDMAELLDPPHARPCANEQQCEWMPWCRISGVCKRISPPARDSR